MVKFSVHMDQTIPRAYVSLLNQTPRIVELDTNGRFTVLRLKTQGETSLNVVNVYAPTDNRDHSEFLDSFSKTITSLTADTSNLVIAVDWNTTSSLLDKQ